MRIITPPANLPVTVEQFARQRHVDDADAVLIGELLQAATSVVETATNRMIVPRRLTLGLPEGNWSRFWLPVAPVIGLADGAGTEIVTPFSEPWIARADAPDDTITVDVGYGTNDVVPAQLGQAILMLAMEWHEAGITVEETYTAPTLSFGFRRLVEQVRYRRPMVVA
ncbi:head-tail connector protein [Paenirhodobacter enshiensis]|uniref:PhiE125 gp8 family phage protein n=1 Tax=Paenirhodobacter enshiensis TaxID=1105367 RepID=A0A086XQN0_9RHOB|nr:hypothetical protein [Paenirhodobacter enshiensis]KFI24330.1 hypothetical protein CG50_10810 [Paenirhodobacter enshiensis]